MITEAVMTFFTLLLKGLIAATVALVPDAPEWAATGFSALGTVWGYLTGLDTWIPVDFAVTVALAIITAYLVSIGLQVAKMIASYMTFGGGAH